MRNGLINALVMGKKDISKSSDIMAAFSEAEDKIY